MLLNLSKLVYFSLCDFQKVVFYSEGLKSRWIYDVHKNCIKTSSSKKDKFRIMNRSILDVTEPSVGISHLNNNIFDCRRSNLSLYSIVKNDIKYCPAYFREWYMDNRQSNDLPEHCFYCKDMAFSNEYFLIKNNHSALKKKTNSGRITSMFEKKYNLIEKFVQIEKALFFINTMHQFGIDWENREVKMHMLNYNFFIY